MKLVSLVFACVLLSSTIFATEPPDYRTICPVHACPEALGHPIRTGGPCLCGDNAPQPEPDCNAVPLPDPSTEPELDTHPEPEQKPEAEERHPHPDSQPERPMPGFGGHHPDQHFPMRRSFRQDPDSVRDQVEQLTEDTRIKLEDVECPEERAKIQGSYLEQVHEIEHGEPLPDHIKDRLNPDIVTFESDEPEKEEDDE